MSRYINDETVLNAIKDYGVDAPEYMEGWACKLVDAVKGDIYGLVKEIPTVDAVPVVRCKDCMHKHPYNNVWLCRFGLMMAGDDGYCSYGEKVSE